MLTRFDPWRELDRLAWGGTRARPGMPMDAYRRGDEFVVHFDLPGTEPNSIDVSVDKKVLTVRAERRQEPGEGTEVLLSERPQGTYVRRVFLGEALDVDNIEAHYDNGVLTLVIPVAEAAKPRRVEIAAGNGAKAIEADTKTA